MKSTEPDERTTSLRKQASGLATSPGVYSLRGDSGILYVGKAANLKHRVSSYFSGRAANSRLTRLVQLTESFDITLTRTEAEALLLEDRLIKEHRPPYNIMLRDDKTYPRIRLSNHPVPGIYFHRGPQKSGQSYFGPFASVSATRQTINEIRRTFRLRNCTDSVFNSRSRPCLQYQIGRCSAPCVNLISKAEYRADCTSAKSFLTDRSLDVLHRLGEQMAQASESQEYERAGKLRDRISSLSRIRQNQAIYAIDKADCDVLDAVADGGVVCVGMVQIRKGALAASSTHFPKMPRRAATGAPLTRLAEEALAAFLSRWYLANPAWIPPLLRIPASLPDRALLEEAFSHRAGRRVQLRTVRSGQPREWLRIARTNAEAALRSQLQDGSRFKKRMLDLFERMGLKNPPGRLECCDVSHHSGEGAVVSCVVFDIKGAIRSAWRTYRLRQTDAGDDYGALREALRRRYAKMPSADRPDILILDGGKGQLSSAMAVLKELDIELPVVMAIAKGPDRKAGREQLFCGDPVAQVELEPNSPARLLVQYVRDEAHRFAIRTHRRGMRASRKRSVLEDIPGIGTTARKALLQHFGGLKDIRRADVQSLEQVAGIGPQRALSIYNYLHG